MTDRGPLALLISGPAGAGKTTTGRAVARHLRAALLDLDTLTNPLVDLLAEDAGVVGDYADPALASRVRHPRYEALIATAVDCLSAGCPVVVVAPFTRERTDPGLRDRLEARLRAAGGDPVMAWLNAPAEVRRERMGRRGAARDAAFIARPDDGHPAADTAAPVGEHLVVDATAATSDQVADILSHLVAPPTGGQEVRRR